MSDCHERGETRIRWAPRLDGLAESVQFTPGYNCPVTGWSGHGVHGHRPQYEDHERERCGLLDGWCYYSEWISGADPLVPEFMAKGEQVIWDALEAKYKELAAEEAEATAAARES